MKFTKTDLQEMVYDESEILTKIEDNVVGNSRWSIQHVVIFKYKDKYYRTFYSVRATENQYEEPFEYSDNEIECEEVILKEVKVKEWVTK